MTGETARWSVVEFDADRTVIAVRTRADEADARKLFAYVTSERSQHSDVVQRARSAALLDSGQAVEACSIKATHRAPWVGAQRLRVLDPDTRERLHALDLYAARLALAALRVDGVPRVGPLWARIRAVACDLWDTVRGHDSPGGDGDGWWLVEWTCGDHQAERTRQALHGACPYHHTATAHGPTLVER